MVELLRALIQVRDSVVKGFLKHRFKNNGSVPFLMVKIYVTGGCPYCMKVKSVVSQMNLGKEVEFIGAEQGTPGREVVLKVGGKSQVPFLIDGQTHMYESSDIIAYVRKKFSK